MHQFMKIESYACKGAHKKNSNNRKPAIGDVVAELVRAPHACPHVASPQPPLLLHGCDPNEIPAMARALASGALNRAGHKLRCDSPVVLLGATWPIPRVTMETDQIQREIYSAWRRDTTEALALRGRHLEALEMAAEHDLAERSAILGAEAKLMVAAAQAEAEKRVAKIRRIAVDHITRIGARLESETKAKDRIIALQEEENAEMRRMLAGTGIRWDPSSDCAIDVHEPRQYRKFLFRRRRSRCRTSSPGPITTPFSDDGIGVCIGLNRLDSN